MLRAIADKERSYIELQAIKKYADIKPHNMHWADFIKLSARQAREAELMRKRKWANRRTRNQGT
jgi:hypothetical protein|tara:strand:- start:570 stop:761 length:192 start_codon:yes stop_codon:yes gene_type:complete